MTRCLSKNEAKIFLNVAQIIAASVYTSVDIFQSGPKSHHSYFATFKSKYVTKNFQKSPNLVTLNGGVYIPISSRYSLKGNS